MVGLEALIPGSHLVALAAAGNTFDWHAGAHIKAEVRRVALQVIGERILGEKGPVADRVAHAGKVAERRRCEETERVPALPPLVADSRACLEDDTGPLAPLQVVSSGEARL